MYLVKQGQGQSALVWFKRRWTPCTGPIYLLIHAAVFLPSFPPTILHLLAIFTFSSVFLSSFDMHMSYGCGSTGETWRQNVPRRDVRPSHDVTSDRHTTWGQIVTRRDVRPSHDMTSDRHTTWRQIVTRRDVIPSHDMTSDRHTKEKIR